jgi:hypothetical protein
VREQRVGLEHLSPPLDGSTQRLSAPTPVLRQTNGGQHSTSAAGKQTWSGSRHGGGGDGDGGGGDGRRLGSTLSSAGNAQPKQCPKKQVEPGQQAAVELQLGGLTHGGGDGLGGGGDGGTPLNGAMQRKRPSWTITHVLGQQHGYLMVGLQKPASVQGGGEGGEGGGGGGTGGGEGGGGGGLRQRKKPSLAIVHTLGGQQKWGTFGSQKPAETHGGGEGGGAGGGGDGWGGSTQRK